MKNEVILPSTIEACHQMIIDLTRQIEALRRRAFGKSLKDRAATYTGPSLFDELDEQAKLEASKELEKAAKEVDQAAERRRQEVRSQAKGTGKRPDTYNTYGLPKQEREVYPEGVDLSQYDVIGHDSTSILHIEPARAWVEVIKRPILRAKTDKNAPNPQILQAPKPHSIIGGGHVGADVLATIIDNKYVHHLPEYRQVKMFAQTGLKLPTSTINNWLHAAANVLYPLYESQCEAVRAGGYVQIDEVPWNIADRPGQSCRKGYVWQFHDASPHPAGCYFYYYEGSRAAHIPKAQLKGYQGAIQTDGYNVYDQFDNVPGVTTLACMAHIRRKFVEAQKSNPLAGEVINYIATLYALEENLKEAHADAGQIRIERQRLAVPILKGIEAWMAVALHSCTPKDPLAKAIHYAQSLWPRIMRYTTDGTYHIDNNPVERGQRPSVLGRKNYLFSQSNRYAEDNAIFYTFTVTCQNLGINPHQWLRHAFENIRPDMDEQDIIKLLPCNYKPKAD